jgi:hypothetical protein
MGNVNNSKQNDISSLSPDDKDFKDKLYEECKKLFGDKYYYSIIEYEELKIPRLSVTDDEITYKKNLDIFIVFLKDLFLSLDKKMFTCISDHLTDYDDNVYIPVKTLNDALGMRFSENDIDDIKNYLNKNKKSSDFIQIRYKLYDLVKTQKLTKIKSIKNFSDLLFKDNFNDFFKKFLLGNKNFYICTQKNKLIIYHTKYDDVIKLPDTIIRKNPLYNIISSDDSVEYKANIKDGLDKIKNILSKYDMSKIKNTLSIVDGKKKKKSTKKKTKKSPKKRL